MRGSRFLSLAVEADWIGLGLKIFLGYESVLSFGARTHTPVLRTYGLTVVCPCGLGLCLE